MNLRKLYKENLWAFCKKGLGFNELEAGHHMVCDRLTAPSKRKLIVQPRGTFKTSIASIGFPLWLAINNPSIRILLVAKTEKNAKRRVRMIRERGIEKNKHLTDLFPFLLPRDRHKRRWSDEATCIDRPKEELESTFEAAGITSSLPSRHYDVIICDDIIAADADDMTAEEVLPSPLEIAKAIGFHKMLPTLLAPPIETKIIAHIATKWDNKDVIQYILDNELEYYDYVNLGINDLKGQPTFPGIFTPEAVEMLKRTCSPQMFALQYENKALPAGGHMVEDWMLQTFDRAPKGLNIAITVDPALSKKKVASKAVVLVAGMSAEKRIYVLDYVAKHGIKPSEIVSIIFSFHKKYHPRRVGIEVGGYQGSLIFDTKDEMERRNYYFSVGELKTKGIEKTARIKRLEPVVTKGKLFIRPSQKSLRAELLDFPATRSASYDILDALAYQLDLLKKGEATEQPKPSDSPYSLDSMLRRIEERGTGFFKKSKVDFNIRSSIRV